MTHLRTGPDAVTRGARRPWRLIVAVLALSAIACTKDSSMPQAEAATAASSPLASITDAQWARLAQRTIFFGHQSVGQNIVEGIQEVLRTNPRIGLRVIDGASDASAHGPGLIHRAIGKNYDPGSKDTAFTHAVAGMTEPGAIAMYKYCFVDMTPSTDVDQLFAQYEKTIDGVRAHEANVTIVHITMPLLVASPAPFKQLVKTMLGRGVDPEVANNVKRNRFNQLLVARYAGKEPVFDLARIESTKPDGTRSFFIKDGQTVYTLAREFTTDGGHLNAQGRRAEAEQLLAMLASL